MKIAVAGGGIAGTTVAWQLSIQGHEVTLFEQAAKCGPVGAGILLQPSGQAVLQELGLLDAIVKCSPQINRLHAKHRLGGTLVNLPYIKVADHLFGLGVLRSDLFTLLLDNCINSGVQLRERHQIVRYDQSDSNVNLFTSDERDAGQFDLLIVADGSNSSLRKHSGLTKSIREYPDAALWTIGPFTGDRKQLLQVVGRCGRLIGMLPIGEDRCSFFWGLKKTDERATREAGVESWKRQVAEFYSPAEEAVSEIQSMDELIFASYRSVQMKCVTHGRVAFIGDAAHASSPHLGQGLNLALEDAYCLSKEISEQDDFQTAFKNYETTRKSTSNFYCKLTGTLTPFFQTSNRIMQFGRDISLPIMPHLPYIGKQMVMTMAGLKTGWLSDKFNTEM